MAQQAIVSIKLEGGKSIKPFAQLVIVQRADWHHNFEVRLPLEVFEDKDGSLVENSHQYIGKTITIEIKSQFIGGTPNTFKGIVTEVSSSRHHGSDRELVFRGQSPTILLDDGPNNCSYTEKSLKQIADECTKTYPQNLISTSFSPKNSATIPYTVQYYESCYHFLSRLASLNGEWFYYDGTSIVFGEPTGPSTVLNFGKDLSHFSHSLKVGPSKYKLYSYDYLANQVHESPSSSASVPGLGNSSKLALGESESLFSNEPLHLTSRAVKEKSELDELNKNTKSKRASDLVVFSGISDNPGVTIGGKVKINRSKGSGENITVDDLGEYIVIGVSHSTDGRGNYQNQFEAIPATVASPPPNRNVANPVCDADGVKVSFDRIATLVVPAYIDATTLFPPELAIVSITKLSLIHI